MLPSLQNRFTRQYHYNRDAGEGVGEGWGTGTQKG